MAGEWKEEKLTCRGVKCKRCLREIIPYETTWVLSQPGRLDFNIHRCQGVLSEHEPYNAPDTIEKRRIRMIDLLKALFFLIVAYLILATLFNWWPINTLGWSM